ncbi:alpha/beta hydrolase [Bacillus sp. DX1.1]|uniref:alpha/beta fold hydrolase n=1 Tax=unclassified Bacillus (in: firmicutes) TaxID=185979 RepID=UPI0025712359|nr:MULTISPECIES: alpha/beta hydrolase [unclassified Bacillus (in: firmicutes)]MDM5155949.1 alpha/beta hydrolase [Bacillus sp. DX1.1]WJE84123.1 alpha/beta hydrolase [Bacillus sp. DX3.1]
MMIAYERNKYPPLGQLVEVNGENMHVYTKGEGENTIVLLSGAGTSAPALDYEPLMNEMAKNNRIVVIETFGYGWSDITNKERTVENIVEEIRDALKKANIEGPYILMPHSVSGIYSMYYANKYPDEIKAIIGIDCTLPQVVEYFNESAPTMPRYLSVVAPTGIARLAVSMNPEKYLPITDKGAYSDDNLKMTKSISAWNLGNKNIVAEVNEMKHNIDKTIDMSFPSEIPVMIFTDKDDKVTEDGKTIVSFYQTQISHLPFNKLVVLEGHHYLHWSCYKEISETVNDFIDTF